MLSVPYLFPPEFSSCDTAGPIIKFLWLLPVHASEVAYRHAHGIEALESLLEQQRINVLDECRAPAV
jgi:hypothetical protein